MIADWHALMSEYKSPRKIQKAILSNLADWLAAGLNPEKSTIFLQSDVPEHTELHAILSTITPIPWLERCPTYKEQLQELKEKDVFTYAFLGYPVLQTADIALYQADAVPVGKDQIPHLELGREIIRRFHHLFDCDIFPEPEALLDSQAHKILGLDRRKMSKSYNNYIEISAEEDVLFKKVGKMLTDQSRIRLNDIGHPDICNVYSYYEIFAQEQTVDVREWCEGAHKGCSDCKKNLAAIINDTLAPIRTKKNALMKNPKELYALLKEGAKKARVVAGETMEQVRKAIQIGVKDGL
jgi:tryptophanyl-tRNA synthetase